MLKEMKTHTHLKPGLVRPREPLDKATYRKYRLSKEEY